MAFFTNLSILLVLACISHQLMVGSCQKSSGRRGRRVGGGQHKDRAAPKAGSAQPIGGKLLTKDRSHCVWAASGQDLLTLRVACRNGGGSFSCDYVAKPSVCPQFASDSDLYWRQIARALRKRRRVCRGGAELLRAPMCRGAARDAHFRLREAPHAAPPAPGAGSCQSSNRKLAQEFCSDSWSSFCTFFFTMVQDSDC
ncbi:fibroblast growth factor-binding protein 1 [Betta splendens]|uniref:Fibroblast growth factor-binding protein 1 n=1 Tax=Betta splendens TaxID=158456 RepID=A0A6P7NT99_BETSP|nr:fibroblast growth factor-binding protein 1 [Betta splendens]